MIIRILDHAFILLTIVFTVYSQLVMRWQVSLAGSLPENIMGKLSFLGALLINPWVLSGIVATFLAGISWMLAMTRFEISYAFPFVSLNYIFILAAGFMFFHETFSLTKAIGSALVVLGVLVIARG